MTQSCMLYVKADARADVKEKVTEFSFAVGLISTLIRLQDLNF